MKICESCKKPAKKLKRTTLAGMIAELCPECSLRWENQEHENNRGYERIALHLLKTGFDFGRLSHDRD